MLSVGLTGGIGSGKSLAARLFSQLGAHLIDADVIAREVVLPGQDGWERVVEHFGADILGQDGCIDRKRMGDIVFGDAQKRGQLNALLHPLITARLQSHQALIAAEYPEGIIIADVPLLIECGMTGDFDKIVLVYADRETRIKRLIRRNGLTEQEAEKRLRAQMDLQKKIKYADFVINNTGDREFLKKEVARVYMMLHPPKNGQ